MYIVIVMIIITTKMTIVAKIMIITIVNIKHKK